MKFKIRWSEIKLDPLHIVWVLGYAIAFSVAIPVLPELLNKLFFGGKPLWLARFIGGVPFVEAGGLRIAEALDRFSGKELAAVWKSGHTRVLISILMTYVLALPLFAWGIRERALWRQEAGVRRFPTKIVLALGLSSSFVLGACVAATVPPFIALGVRKSLESAQRVQANRDALINDINYAALRAQSFYFTDVVDGGGGGRWKNILRGGNPMLGIEEVAPAEPIVGKVTRSFFPQSPSRFLLKVHTQDSVTIWGIGKEGGDDDTFTNEDGRRGRLQLKATVTPKKMYVTIQN